MNNKYNISLIAAMSKNGVIGREQSAFMAFTKRFSMV